MNDKDTLLPCPFCGEEASITETIYKDFRLVHRCKVAGFIKIESMTEASAVKAWNTRATSAPAGDVVLPSWLMSSAQALLNLDANGSLVPHGIGGHARSIIQAFIDAHTAIPAPSVVGEDKHVKKRNPKCKKCGGTGKYTWTDYSNGQGLDIDRTEDCDCIAAGVINGGGK